jgi:6-phosphogluconolactonase
MKTLQRLIAILLPLITLACSSGSTPEKILFYVGSSDGSLERSIFLCELDYPTGQVTIVDSFPGSKASSYLALSPDNDFLYAIDGTQSDPEKKHSSVTSFQVTDGDGRLKMMNRQSSEGRGPCHISCHPDGSFIFVANYSEGNIAAYMLGDDGSISPASDIIQHTGSGPGKRQTKAYAHHITADPSSNYILATDLGADKVFIYKLDQESGKLSPNPEQEFFKTEPGAGPRHLAFHPTKPYLYIVNELNGTTVSCHYDGQSGKIKEINTQSNLPEEANIADNYPAAVRVHPDGSYVYASNRVGDNSISVFRIGGSGEIERIQVMEEVPAHPRDFNIDPSGKFLLVAGQQGNAIEIFRIDGDTGKLNRIGQKIQMQAPACILFID